MGQKQHFYASDQGSLESLIEETGSTGPEYSSDPNDWCPKHGPHPSD